MPPFSQNDVHRYFSKKGIKRRKHAQPNVDVTMQRHASGSESICCQNWVFSARKQTAKETKVYETWSSEFICMTVTSWSPIQRCLLKGFFISALHSPKVSARTKHFNCWMLGHGLIFTYLIAANIAMLLRQIFAASLMKLCMRLASCRSSL